MSNPDAAFGLRPVRHLDGTPWNGATIRCYCSASYATALYVGDPVTLSAVAADKDASGKYQTITLSAGTDGAIIRGVIVSFEPDPTNLNRIYRPLSTERWANVCVATPDLVFQIRDDGDGTPAAAWVGRNAIMQAGTASTVTGLSGYELDGSTNPTVDQSYPLYIVGLADIADNELGDHAIWDVIINTCYNATGLILGVSGA